MRHPSARILKDRCDLYPGTPTQDIDGGPQWKYDPTPAIEDIPCSVQAQEVEELIDDQGRLTRWLYYKVLLGGNPAVVLAGQRVAGQAVATSTPIAVKPRDKITYVDDIGITRTLFVQVIRNEAGRGGAWVIRATERI